MAKRKLRLLATLLVLAVIFMFLSLPAGAGAVRAEEEQKKEQTRGDYIRHVFFLLVGGLSEEAIRAGWTPVISGLGGGGVTGGVFLPFPGDFPRLARALINPGGAEKGKDLPGVLQERGQKVLLVDSIGVVTVGKEVKKAKTDEEAVNLVLHELETGKPFFVFIALRGALGREGDKNYRQVITGTDNLIGRLVTRLQEYGIFDQSLLVVCGSGNGMLGRGKVTKEEDIVAPVIVRGPFIGVSAKRSSGSAESLGKTLAYLLGVGNDQQGILWDWLRLQGEGEGYLAVRRLDEISADLAKTKLALYRYRSQEHLLAKEKSLLQQEREETKRMVRRKEEAIESLRLKNRVLVGVLLLVIALMGSGYYVEYRFLKKKFLLFK
ncbi:MAG: hypothetical protein PWQ91_1234 [Eubacteriales bacterium]|nr:hypothetical protein [Eubacteriales bacterium]MDN5364173.1 hypothetical protein [Eubacteriales bacterium]